MTVQKQCKKTYDELFLSKLVKVCPHETSIFPKQTREIITIGIILIALVASAGIGIRAWGVSKTYSLETKQEELKTTLDDLQREVFKGEKKL